MGIFLTILLENEMVKNSKRQNSYFLYFLVVTEKKMF